MLMHAHNNRLGRSILPYVNEISASTLHHIPRPISRPKVPLVLLLQSSFSDRISLGAKGYAQKPPVRGRTSRNVPLPCAQYCPLSTQSTIRKPQNQELCHFESAGAGEPTIHALFEKKTGTWQYVVVDPASFSAVIIDPVLDYDPTTQIVSTQSADSLLNIVEECGYSIQMILETHIHADHLTAASYLQSKLDRDQGIRPTIGIGKRINQVQNLFAQRYAVPVAEYKSAFDKLFDDDESFKIGELTATAIHLPGHTPDHLGYRIGENVFCGDSIFHADIGTARCDFPGGSAYDLFHSGKKLLNLPAQVKIWTGHDYPPPGRDAPSPWMSVQEHRQHNKHLMDGMTLREYTALREKRDAQLPEPKLQHQSLQMNIRAGRPPEPTKSGHRMLHLPMKIQGVWW